MLRRPQRIKRVRSIHSIPAHPPLSTIQSRLSSPIPIRRARHRRISIPSSSTHIRSRGREHCRVRKETFVESLLLLLLPLSLLRLKALSKVSGLHHVLLAGRAEGGAEHASETGTDAAETDTETVRVAGKERGGRLHGRGNGCKELTKGSLYLGVGTLLALLPLVLLLLLSLLLHCFLHLLHLSIVPAMQCRGCRGCHAAWRAVDIVLVRHPLSRRCRAIVGIARGSAALERANQFGSMQRQRLTGHTKRCARRVRRTPALSS